MTMPLQEIAREIRERLAMMDEGLIAEGEVFAFSLDQLCHAGEEDRLTIVRVIADGLDGIGPAVTCAGWSGGIGDPDHSSDDAAASLAPTFLDEV